MAEPDPSPAEHQDATRGSEKHSYAVDGHVHLQEDFSREEAARNFASTAPNRTPVCLVVESYGIDRYAKLARELDSWGALGLRDPARNLHFVAGRQIVSGEGLEVLLIGFREQSLEGLPASEIIEVGLSQDALVCLPWGFGKWLGERRALAQELAEDYGKLIVLGDIMNRPSLWSEPLFDGASKVLRGADNLPMPGTTKWVGRFGNILASDAPLRRAEEMVALLRDSASEFIPYGKRKGTFASVGEQIRYRLQARSA